MVEVFKTNVEDSDVAARLVEKMESTFSPCAVNFDLEDCDRIMRVKCERGEIDSESIIAFLNADGFEAEILEDEIEMFQAH